MTETDFKFEDDVLKHHVRVNGWLPRCRRRLRAIHAKAARRLRYFTFCAVGAIDVLMLDVAKVVRQSKTAGFDTVFFFNMDSERVKETRKRIPGAVGFVGDFVQTILSLDTEGEYRGLISAETEEVSDAETAALEPPAERPNTAEERQSERRRAEALRFFQQFPFDVINLDLEEFFFKPKDELPGRVVAALRRICDWQRRRLDGEALDGFTLMFTTQIGPPNMTDEYREMLKRTLLRNIELRPVLREKLRTRLGIDDVDVLARDRFDAFFKLAVPKLIANILLERDWYVDPGEGVKVFEFQRDSKDGPYSILHLVLDVMRQEPPREKREPGLEITREAEEAYKSVVELIFETEEELVTPKSVDRDELKASLTLIKARRRKYYPEDVQV